MLKHLCVCVPEHHHDNHHDGEDGDGTSRHVHDEQVHGNLKKLKIEIFETPNYLFEGPQCEVPAPFNPKVGVSLPGGICMHQSTPCGTEARGRGELHILT